MPKQVHVDHEGLTVGTAYLGEGKVVEIVFVVAFLLPSGLAEQLFEVALLVEEAHADEGEAEVAGGLEMVAGEDAEASGEDGEALGKAELGREVSDQRMVEALRISFVEPSGFGVKVGVEIGLDAMEMTEEGVIDGGGFEFFLLDGSEDQHRIVASGFPEVAIEAAEEFDGIVCPAPAEVEGEFAECFDGGRKAGNDSEVLHWFHKVSCAYKGGICASSQW
jgi:hypothetical protein